MVVGNPIVEDGEATGPNSPHSNNKAIIKRHASTEVDHHKEEEEGQIQGNKDLGCILQFGNNFAKYGTRHFCLHYFRWLFLLLSIIARKDQHPIPPIKWVKTTPEEKEGLRDEDVI